jgi:imidazolonepropionase-like amidohydrolase
MGSVEVDKVADLIILNKIHLRILEIYNNRNNNQTGTVYNQKELLNTLK